MCAIQWPLGDVDDDRNWHLVKSVTFENVDLETVYRGATGPQPRFYLTGSAMTLEIVDDHAVIR